MNIKIIGTHSEHTEVSVTHRAEYLASELCGVIRSALGIVSWWKIEQGPEKTRIVSFKERDKSKTVEVENPTPLQLRALTTCLEFEKLIEDVENEKNSAISALPASIRNLVGL